MKPALVYINTISRELIEKQQLSSDKHKLSLRHLDVGISGTVIVGGQLQEGTPIKTPLVLRYILGTLPELIQLPIEL